MVSPDSGMLSRASFAHGGNQSLPDQQKTGVGDCDVVLTSSP